MATDEEARYYATAMAKAEERAHRHGFEDGIFYAKTWIEWLIALGTWARAHGKPIVHREYFTREIDGQLVYTCFCPGCGFAYMKGLVAGEDEDTDAEWCGSCRY